MREHRVFSAHHEELNEAQEKEGGVNEWTFSAYLEELKQA